MGDLVRLATTQTKFEKGHLPKWTTELFLVVKTFADDPPYYEMKDQNKEELRGTFYNSEVQKVVKNDDTN